MCKLLIVDDEPLVQVGIKSMLNWSELNIEVCGTAMNGQAALKIIETQSPDIVITDIKMPVMDGLELAKICRERYGNKWPVFIMLTSYEDFQMAKKALYYQASDYLIKLELSAEGLRDSVLHAIELIAQNESRERLSTTEVHPFYDKFFIRLLNNLFESEEQFILQSKDLNLDFHYAGYVCCYGEMLSPSADLLPMEKQLSLFSPSLQMIKELLAKYIPCYALSLDIRHFALIFCYETVTSEITVSYGVKLKEILSKGNSTLHNYYNVTFLAGIGNLVKIPLSISESYQFSRQSCRFADSSTPVAFFEDCLKKDLSHESFNISLFKTDLTRAFEEYDPDILKKTIEEICSLFSAHPGSYVQALDAACNILYLSISLLQNGETIVSDIFRENVEGYRSIYKQTTVEQIISWLTYFSNQLCILFENRRKDYKNHIVDSVKKYINDHISERLSLNEVAAVFGISPNYLSQLFGKYNETGFSEYINICKINESKKLLNEEKFKIYEVAEMLGFESAFYFSKVFKKVEGISPTEYLNSKYL